MLLHLLPCSNIHRVRGSVAKTRLWRKTGGMLESHSTVSSRVAVSVAAGHGWRLRLLKAAVDFAQSRSAQQKATPTLDVTGLPLVAVSVAAGHGRRLRTPLTRNRACRAGAGARTVKVAETVQAAIFLAMIHLCLWNMTPTVQRLRVSTMI